MASFFDYVFVSFTNTMAFSPTDMLSVSVRAKLLFMVGSSASLLAVGLLPAHRKHPLMSIFGFVHLAETANQ